MAVNVSADEVCTMTSDESPPDDDPLITKYVEAALAVCAGRMPPEYVELVRARLYLFYETNPEAVALLDEIRAAQQPEPTVARSGEQVRRDLAALEEASKRAGGGQ